MIRVTTTTMAKAQSRIICVDFILPLSERTAVGHVDGNSKQASPSGSNRLGAGQVSFASVFQSEISSHSEENRSSDEDVIITSAVVEAFTSKRLHGPRKFTEGGWPTRW